MSSRFIERLEKLSTGSKELHRALASLQEELEAIDWYQQRVDLCKDEDLKRILTHNMEGEIEHAAMVLEWLRRNNSMFEKELKGNLFTDDEVGYE